VIPALLSAALVGACGNAACPDGFVQVGGTCVVPVGDAGPSDSGSDEDSGTPVDAFSGLDTPPLVGIDAFAIDAFVPSDAGSDAPLPDAFLDIDGCSPRTFYVDSDGDGFGNAALSIVSCEASVAGYTLDATDCDDDCNSCRPGGTETCDGRDNDCIGGVDDGVLLTFHADCDRDGFTAAGAPTVLSCSTPAAGPAVCPSGGWAPAASPTPDCDDTCAVCFPGNPEVCDERDNNCDLTIDEGVRTTFVADCDRDGFTASGAVTIAACMMPATAPSGCSGGTWRAGASASVDCNDSCASCFPGGTEVCDGLDQDCVLGVDNGVLLTFYADCDGDTFTPSSAAASPTTGPLTQQACSAPSTRPAGSSCATTGAWRSAPSAMPDCWDGDANTRPNQTAFFTTASSGRPAAVDFDFNCDLIEERVLTTTGGTCPLSTTTGVCGVEGWQTTVPACGATANWVYCSRGSPTGMMGHYLCSGGPAPRTQSCR
jgi:hypothetical protein